MGRRIGNSHQSILPYPTLPYPASYLGKFLPGNHLQYPTLSYPVLPIRLCARTYPYIYIYLFIFL
jgi:hypothetical protein